MARNEEKAQSMLNRWWAFKSGDLDKKERKRPYLASKCNNTIACEKWRLQILHEIGQKVQEIQSGTCYSIQLTLVARSISFSLSAHPPPSYDRKI